MRLVETLNLDTLTTTLLRALESATPDAIASGRTWYSRWATKIANRGAEYGYCKPESLGAFAALSPNKPLSENWRIYEFALHRSAIPTFTLCADRAAGILSAAPFGDPLDTLRGPKVRAFYRCLLRPGDTWHVCVDRHAAALALAGTAVAGTAGTAGTMPHRVLGWRGGYDAIADAYRLAARQASMVPSALQAVLWIERRRSLGSLTHAGE